MLSFRMIPGRNTHLQTRKERVLEPHSNILSVQQMGYIKKKKPLLRAKTKGETKLQMEAEYSYYLTPKKKKAKCRSIQTQTHTFFSSLKEHSSTYCHNACSVKYYQGRRLYCNIKTFAHSMLILFLLPYPHCNRLHLFLLR